MGTGGRPGITFKTEVISVGDGMATISVPKHEDTIYLETGRHFVVTFTPTPGDRSDSSPTDQG